MSLIHGDANFQPNAYVGVVGDEVTRVIKLLSLWIIYNGSCRNIQNVIPLWLLRLGWNGQGVLLSYFLDTWFMVSGITGLNNSIGPIARNCPKRPSGNNIYWPKLPAKPVFWKFGQQTFSCVNPMCSWLWDVFCKVTVTECWISFCSWSQRFHLHCTYFDYMIS